MACQRKQRGELGDFGIGPFELLADNQAGVGVGKFLEQFLNNRADRVFAGGRKKDLHGRGILLDEPTSQASGGVGVGALKRLEQSERGGKTFHWNFLMERKATTCEPLPKQQKNAQQSKA